MNKFIFIRNDDVRHIIEPELEVFMDIIERQKVPVSLAVEPENITQPVINYLLAKHSFNPHLIEIIQHGLNHNIHQQYPYGIEFGGFRDYVSQMEDLQKGYALMDNIFGNKWNKILTFPYGSYNYETLQAVEDLGYKAISTSISYLPESILKDFIGNALHQQIIFGKKVAYHCKIRKPFQFWDIGVSVNLIKKYLTYDTAMHYGLDSLIHMVERSFQHSNVIGILTHHRYHKAEDMRVFENLIITLKEKGYIFLTISSIIEILEKKLLKQIKDARSF